MPNANSQSLPPLAQSIAPITPMDITWPEALGEEILAAVGPTRMLAVGPVPHTLCEFMACAGCLLQNEGEGRPEPVETVILGESFGDPAALEMRLRVLRQRVSRNLVILTSPTFGTLSRISIESAAIHAGYRRHPGAFAIIDFERNNVESTFRPVILELISDATLCKWSLDHLGIERDLHMDMTREAGARADAHLVRYSLAAEWIRKGDAVLDCACGLGYGTAVLAARSPGDRFLGVDIDPASIDYARDNFGHWGTEYLAASATNLEAVPDCSQDVVVSFETMEHLEDYQSFVSEAARILRPDGRIIVSIPNMWADETGRDPNPHHHHVFDFERCRAALEIQFQVVARYSQTAPGGTKLHGARRTLRQHSLPPTHREPETEWWIVVAIVAAGTVRPPPQEMPHSLRKRSDGFFPAGVRALAEGDDMGARRHFEGGLTDGLRELEGYGGVRGAGLHPTDPASLAARLTSAEECARALDAMYLYRRSPGLFWRRVHPIANPTGDPFVAEAVAGERDELERLRSENHDLYRLTRLRTLLPLRLREIALIIVRRAIARLFSPRS